MPRSRVTSSELVHVIIFPLKSASLRLPYIPTQLSIEDDCILTAARLPLRLDLDFKVNQLDHYVA